MSHYASPHYASSHYASSHYFRPIDTVEIEATLDGGSSNKRRHIWVVGRREFTTPERALAYVDSLKPKIEAAEKLTDTTLYFAGTEIKLEPRAKRAKKALYAKRRLLEAVRQSELILAEQDEEALLVAMLAMMSEDEETIILM